MGENESQDFALSPVNLDLSPVIDQLQKINEQNGEIIKQNNKIVDHFVPTQEEIEKEKKLQEDQLKKDQEEQEIIQQQEEEQRIIQEEKELAQEEYNQELLQEIKLLNENINKVGYNTQYSNNQNYLLLLGLLLVGFCVLTYKILRRFFY